MRPLLLLLLLLQTPLLHGAVRDDQWTALLDKHVVWINNGVASQVDYAGFLSDQDALDAYLASLSAVTPAQYAHWNADQQLAFLLNAYNAFTVKLILQHYPLDSIREIGGLFSNAWQQPFIPLLGKTLTLDDIEHGMIRAPGVFDEPRIHFAVNCASIGCPALLREAFVADRLDAQLADAEQRFLSDRSRNRFNPERRHFEVSKIFKWYGADFAKKWGSLDAYLQRHAALLADPAALTIAGKTSEIEFTDYDWALNQTPPPAQ